MLKATAYDDKYWKKFIWHLFSVLKFSKHFTYTCTEIPTIQYGELVFLYFTWKRKLRLWNSVLGKTTK